MADAPIRVRITAVWSCFYGREGEIVSTDRAGPLPVKVSFGEDDETYFSPAEYEYI